MASRKSYLALLGLMTLCASFSSGCATRGPFLGFFAVPIPITTWQQKTKEDKFWNHERYERAPVLGPIASGAPPVALDSPSDDEVMRAMERVHPVQGFVPFLHVEYRNNVRIVKEKIADYTDPPRHYPIVGPAQLHHAHYKCTVYYTDVKRVGWPVPYTTTDEDAVEVIYIDHNHLHMVGNVNPGAGSNY